MRNTQEHKEDRRKREMKGEYGDWRGGD